MRTLPYGEERWSSGATPTDFTFTGQRNEAGFGLMDYNARYYNPRLGRFISPDSIVPEPASSGGFNRYRYTRNNPLKYADPSGHCSGLSGFAWTACANTVLAVAPAVHKANEYRDDIFFPDENTTFADRLEASAVVGTSAVAIAAAGVEAVAGTLTTAATTGGVATAGGTGGTVAAAACGDGDCANEALAAGNATTNAISNVSNACGGSCTNTINTGTNVVYRSVQNGITRYVGITNDFARRAAEHSGRFNIERISGLDKLNRFDARSAEQVLINNYGLEKNGGTLLNRINSIATSNEIYPEAIERGNEILEQVGFYAQ